MIKKHAVLSVFFTLISSFLYPQAKSDSFFTVKGTVTDSITGETIPYCSVSVANKKTPALFHKRVAADAAGKFSVELNKKDTVLLRFDAVGMKYATRAIVHSGEETMNLGKIPLSAGSKELSEISVIAAKPLVKVDLDKITYDAKSDPEAATSNAFDMLKKVPLITVDAEEKIQLKGKTDYKIFMNGKPSNLTSGNPTELLKTLHASTIKNIEIITEPGVK